MRNHALLCPSQLLAQAAPCAGLRAVDHSTSHAQRSSCHDGCVWGEGGTSTLTLECRYAEKAFTGPGRPIASRSSNWVCSKRTPQFTQHTTRESLLNAAVLKTPPPSQNRNYTQRQPCMQSTTCMASRNPLPFSPNSTTNRTTCAGHSIHYTTHSVVQGRDPTHSRHPPKGQRHGCRAC